MRPLYRRHVLIALVAAAAGCAPAVNIKTDSDPSVQFDKYRTYTWVYSAVPTGMNPLLYQRVRDSIDRSLAARSYTQATPGQFAVAFTLGRRDKVVVTDFGPYAPFYGPYGFPRGYGMNNVDVRNVTDGSLAIDFYDVATHKPIWHAVATQEISANKVDQATIDKAVDAVLARFPPQPGTK